MNKTQFKSFQKRQYEVIIGGKLSSPSKMPCFSFSIPAKHCKVGSKLAKVKGSVCASCYALKNMYLFPVVKNALERRFQALDNPQWVEAMSYIIGTKEKSGYFRFFDSGDLQSVDMLKKIVLICNKLPHIKFWVPTREYKIVNEYITKGNKIPENLTIRLSALMIDGKPPTELAEKLGVVTSTVSKDNYTCLAPKQKNKCMDCRLCWNKNIKNVAYHSH